MSKLSFILILSSLFVSTFFVLQAETRHANSPRVTELLFFMKVIIGGADRTEYRVAQSNITESSGTDFGALNVLDNPITSGPENMSSEIGRLQGFYAYSDFNERAATALFTVVLRSGNCSGSTLSLVGRNLATDSEREWPIVGGTGCFRMASGYVISRDYSSDGTSTSMVQVVQFIGNVRLSG